MFSNYRSYYNKEPEQRCMTDHRIRSRSKSSWKVISPPVRMWQFFTNNNIKQTFIRIFRSYRTLRLMYLIFNYFISGANLIYLVKHDLSLSWLGTIKGGGIKLDVESLD
jgi:hypothetical protein